MTGAINTRWLSYQDWFTTKVSFMTVLTHWNSLFSLLLHKWSLVDRQTGDWNLSEGSVSCYMWGKADIVGLDLCYQDNCGLQMFCNTFLSGMHFWCFWHPLVGQKPSSCLWIPPRHQIHLENANNLIDTKKQGPVHLPPKTQQPSKALPEMCKMQSNLQTLTDWQWRQYYS